MLLESLKSDYLGNVIARFLYAHNSAPPCTVESPEFIDQLTAVRSPGGGDAKQ